ncbi:hypothetical protein JL193_08090 [Polaribacter batillariae]|uniref:Uncharacterized protein n=1 Tax=Polaribacter batillariae TaxID=2808900 RepID=A0ABX7T0B1_9FLAO|nr:hypothetical protein [Polaribacter batillariae]QTD39186.1 hypothetical protein JL193_08090 [Polaribacter batillariae]
MRYKRLEYKDLEYNFLYNEDGSFFNCGVVDDTPWGLEEAGFYTVFEDIEFPEESEMPIKIEYFRTVDLDPTGFEIT